MTCHPFNFEKLRYTGELYNGMQPGERGGITIPLLPRAANREGQS